jgi:protein-S-isoprenylcysteine O-methyltransferase Ste14
MGGIASVLYGVVVYSLFFVTFLYAIAFVGNLPVPKTIDSGAEGPLIPALVINTLLLGLFAIQHSVMARPAFKRWWTRFVPHAVERTTYVLLASLALVLLFWLWRPILAPVWTVTNPTAVLTLQAVSWLGWFLVLLSTFLINHFELFGLQQAWFHVRGREAAKPELRQPLFYRWIAHPLYSGFFLAFWATPEMTAGHLLLAAGVSVYMLIAIRYEERDLTNLFGEDYRRYRSGVGMLTPRFRR